MEKIVIDGHEFEGYRIPTQSANIILIKAANGFLGCGYFSVETADKLRESVAVVTGVKTYDDMLKASVVKLSAAAQQAGITAGMSGRETLLKMI
ncbi:MAG: YunC family protein [Victivallaceae bacterium]